MIGYEGRLFLFLCRMHVLATGQRKNPKGVDARAQPCLTPKRISNGSEQLPLNCTVPFMSVWNDSIMLCSLGGQPIFVKTLEAASADQIKCLSEINESDVQEYLLFSALLLKLSKGD